jgi:hypothetical protein
MNINNSTLALLLGPQLMSRCPGSAYQLGHAIKPHFHMQTNTKDLKKNRIRRAYDFPECTLFLAFTYGGLSAALLWLWN